MNRTFVYPKMIKKKEEKSKDGATVVTDFTFAGEHFEVVSYQQEFSCVPPPKHVITLDPSKVKVLEPETNGNNQESSSKALPPPQDGTSAEKN